VGTVGTGVATLGGAAVLVTTLASPLGDGGLPANIRAEIEGRRRNEEIVRAETMGRSGRAEAARKAENDRIKRDVPEPGRAVKAAEPDAANGPQDRNSDAGAAKDSHTPSRWTQELLASARPRAFEIEPLPVYRELRVQQMPVYRGFRVQQMPVYDELKPMPVYQELKPMPVFRELQPMPLYREVPQVEVFQPKKSKGRRILEGLAIGAAIAAPIVQGVIEAKQAGRASASSDSTAPPAGFCENPAFAPAYTKWLQDVQKGQSGQYVTDPNTPDHRIVARFVPCPKK
jgi:hypothetical protein